METTVPPSAVPNISPVSTEPKGRRWTSFTFQADRAVFRGIVLREMLLVAATLGIYWFWARTRVRRFLWANTAINGSPLEYSGRGIELFIGFMVASVIVGLLYWITNFIALTISDPATAIITSTAAIVLLLSILSAIAVYRTRRYLVRRTSWRGIRCGLSGTTAGMLRKAILPALATALTLGAAFPWLSVVVQRYLIDNMSLGSAQFRYDGQARSLIWTWVACLLLYPFTLGLSLVWWSGYLARYHYNSIKLEGLSLYSEIRPMRVVGIYFVGYLIGSIIVYPIFSGIFFGYVEAGLDRNIVVTIILGAIYFGLFFAATWGLFLYLISYLTMEHYLTTLTIQGSMDWSKIEQVHDETSGPGDGLDAVLSMDGI